MSRSAIVSRIAHVEPGRAPDLRGDGFWWDELRPDFAKTEERFEFRQLTVLSGSFPTPTATVELQVDGTPRKTTATGVGPVDAIFKAVAELTETKSELVRYQVNAITAGLDAQGEVSVTLSEGGRRVIGHGAHYDVLVASAKAYVHALNKLEWHKKRHAVAEPKGI